MGKRSRKRRRPGDKTAASWVLLLVFALAVWWVIRLYMRESPRLDHTATL